MLVIKPSLMKLKIFMLKISLQGIWRKFERNESPWLVCVCISDPDNTEGDEDEVEEIGKTHVLLGKHYNKTSFVCLLHSSVWYNKKSQFVFLSYLKWKYKKNTHKKIGVEIFSDFTQTLLVKFTNNYNEVASYSIKHDFLKENWNSSTYSNNLFYSVHLLDKQHFMRY